MVAGDSKTLDGMSTAGDWSGATAATMTTAALGLGLGQGVGDWVDHGGPVEPEPPAGHRRKLRERGDQGLLSGHDPGARVRGNSRVGGREREPAKRTAEAVARLDQLRKQQLPVAGPTASADAHRVTSSSVICPPAAGRVHVVGWWWWSWSFAP